MMNINRFRPKTKSSHNNSNDDPGTNKNKGSLIGF